MVIERRGSPRDRILKTVYLEEVRRFEVNLPPEKKLKEIRPLPMALDYAKIYRVRRWPCGIKLSGGEILNLMATLGAQFVLTLGENCVRPLHSKKRALANVVNSLRRV